MWVGVCEANCGYLLIIWGISVLLQLGQFLCPLSIIICYAVVCSLAATLLYIIAGTVLMCVVRCPAHSWADLTTGTKHGAFLLNLNSTPCSTVDINTQVCRYV